MKNKIFIILAATFMLLSCSSATMGNNENPTEGTEEGDKAPDFTYTSLAGDTITLSKFSGKVVMLYLFGNQCPTCNTTGDLTESKINQIYKGNGFQAIGLDTWDNTSNHSTVAAFKSSTGITFPLCLQAGSMTDLYATTYDRLIVIDQQGVIRFKGQKPISFDVDNAANLIGELLK